MVCKIETTYPAQYETEVILKDGSNLKLRPIRKDDTERWLAFISKLGPHTKYLRFHHVTKAFTQDDAIHFCNVDYQNTFAFVAEVLREQREEIVAIGRYYRLPKKDHAEIALAIEDTYQGKGIGTHLMQGLVKVARDNGITVFEADVLRENDQMMDVFRNYGFHITSELDTGVYHAIFPIVPTKRIVKKEEERERISSVASVRSILYPRSVAIIGASRKPASIGHLLLECILKSGFSGVVYPVNPTTESVMSIKAYPSVIDIQGSVDLAVIAVPAHLVSKVTYECGSKGVRAIIVISDGFRERGPEGAELERELRDIALGYGMRLVGPNCMGVINTDPAINLNATFSPVYPPQGNVAFLSQSGALGLAILEYAENLNMGISTFASIGNRADVSPNDLLQYWEQDPATKVILLYLESFGNPRNFSRIGRRVATTKPIIAVKGGSTKAGSRAASSHTGAMATQDIASDALFRQAGIIRVNVLEELFDVATLLSNQPIPKGRKVVVVTNGGGPGILAADACERQGLVLPEFSQELAEKLKSATKRDILFHNPIDLTAAATEQDFEAVLKTLANDNGNDAVISMFIPPTVVDLSGMEEAIRRVAPIFQRHKKPLIVCFMGRRGFKAKLGTEGKYVPCYPFPETAVSALARAVEYSEWKKRPKGIIPKIRGIKREYAKKVMGKALTRSSQRPLWLSVEEVADLLNCYGIYITESLTAKTTAEAIALANKIGFPVAVKLASSTILHKTDVGGVMLNLESANAVEQAFNDIKSALARIGREHEMDGVTIQHMVKGGIETIIGVTQDPSFGPLIMFGIGGVYAELLKDVAIRLHPLTDLDARELVSSIKMAKILQGFRGSSPSDIQAVEDLLLRISALIEDMPQISELDLNPVKVMPQGEGYWIVDARIAIR